MSYITVNDCQSRLRADFDRLYELPVEQADLNRDMVDAEAVVNGYVGKRYEVPVTDTQALTLVKAWTLDLFVELAYQRTAGSVIPEKVKERAETVRHQLIDISKGNITLAGASNLNPPSGLNVATVDGPKPMFRDEHMSGF